MDTSKNETDRNASASNPNQAPPERPRGRAARRPKVRKSRGRVAREWIVSLAGAIAILAPLRSSLADWNDVPTGSMEPTILPGERIFVWKAAYGLRVPFTRTYAVRWDEPSPGDIVTLFSPKDGTRLVKRVVAGPGDVVELRDGRLWLNGSPLLYAPPSVGETEASRLAGGPGIPSPAAETIGGHRHVVLSRPVRGAARSFGPVMVPQGMCWVMGDNRDASADSRVFGLVPISSVTGRAETVVASVDPARWYVPRWGRWFRDLE